MTEPVMKLYADGAKHWYRDGKLHREDGPAIEYADGGKEWYLNGKFIDIYYPGFGCYTPKTKQEAMDRLNTKDRPYSRELYLKDIERMFDND